MIEELKNIKSGKKELREFGLTIGIILVALGLAVMWRGKKEIAPVLIATGAALITLGLTVPAALKPLQKIWMGIAVVIGFFVTRVILSILFYAVLSPIGLVARLLRKDLLEQKIDKSKESYWQDRENPAKTKESYENQY